MIEIIEGTFYGWRIKIDGKIEEKDRVKDFRSNKTLDAYLRELRGQAHFYSLFQLEDGTIEEQPLREEGQVGFLAYKRDGKWYMGMPPMEYDLHASA